MQEHVDTLILGPLVVTMDAEERLIDSSSAAFHAANSTGAIPWQPNNSRPI